MDSILSVVPIYPLVMIFTAHLFNQKIIPTNHEWESREAAKVRGLVRPMLEKDPLPCSNWRVARLRADFGRVVLEGIGLGNIHQEWEIKWKRKLHGNWDYIVLGCFGKLCRIPVGIGQNVVQIIFHTCCHFGNRNVVQVPHGLFEGISVCSWVDGNYGYGAVVRLRSGTCRGAWCLKTGFCGSSM